MLFYRPTTGLALLLAAAGAQAEQPELALPTPLTRDALVDAVLRRNPTVEAANQAVRAAELLLPAAGAYPDPMLGLQTAPASVASDHGFGWGLSVKQALPWSEMRRAAGQLQVLKARILQEGSGAQREALTIAAALAFERLASVEALRRINDDRRREAETPRWSKAIRSWCRPAEVRLAPIRVA